MPGAYAKRRRRTPQFTRPREGVSPNRKTKFFLCSPCLLLFTNSRLIRRGFGALSSPPLVRLQLRIRVQHPPQQRPRIYVLQRQLLPHRPAVAQRIGNQMVHPLRSRRNLFQEWFGLGLDAYLLDHLRKPAHRPQRRLPIMRNRVREMLQLGHQFLGAAAAIAAHGLKGFRVASPTAVFSCTFDPELPQHESMESSVHLLAEIVCRDTQQTLETVLAWFSKRVESPPKPHVPTTSWTL